MKTQHTIQPGAAGAKATKVRLDVASGKKTWAEHWKLHNALTLFNPAPIT